MSISFLLQYCEVLAKSSRIGRYFPENFSRKKYKTVHVEQTKIQQAILISVIKPQYEQF